MYYQKICWGPIKCSNYFCNCCCGDQVEGELVLTATASKTKSSTEDNTNTETVKSDSP